MRTDLFSVGTAGRISRVCGPSVSPAARTRAQGRWRSELQRVRVSFFSHEPLSIRNSIVAESGPAVRNTPAAVPLKGMVIGCASPEDRSTGLSTKPDRVFAVPSGCHLGLRVQP